MLLTVHKVYNFTAQLYCPLMKPKTTVIKNSLIPYGREQFSSKNLLVINDQVIEIFECLCEVTTPTNNINTYR